MSQARWRAEQYARANHKSELTELAYRKKDKGEHSTYFKAGQLSPLFGEPAEFRIVLIVLQHRQPPDKQRRHKISLAGSAWARARAPPETRRRKGKKDARAHTNVRGGSDATYLRFTKVVSACGLRSPHITEFLELVAADAGTSGAQ